MIELFLEDSPGHLSAIAEAISRCDAGALEHAAHRLRGSSAALGAIRLANYCGQLEQLGRGNTTAGAEQSFARIDAELTLVKAALDECRSEQDARVLLTD
jgi:HPt (histidine-containing phosphotransfer) domain-containing protein